MISLDHRAAFTRHTRWLAMTLEALVLLALLASVIPLAPTQPIWWLRLSDATVNLAPVILMAVILLRVGSVLIDSQSNDAKTNGRRSYQLATRWAFVFALLVPLQLIGFAWLWADSDQQMNKQISDSETQSAELRTRLMASGSKSDLERLLAENNLGPLPRLKSESLADEKQQLSEAIAINISRFQSNLRTQRAAMLRNSIPGTLRGLIGAAIVSTFLFLLRKELRLIK